AGPEFFAKVRELTEKGKSADAIQLLQNEIQKNSKSDEKGLVPFNLAIVYYNTAAYDKAISTFEQILKEKTSLHEYAYFYRGMSYFKSGKLELAQSDFKKIDELSPNVKLKIESISMLGQIALKRENYKEAKNYFQKIEKRTRSTEDYPETLYFMAL